MFPWGNTSVAGNLLNFADRNLAVDWADNDADDGYQYTAPVGTYPAGASPYGVMDMAGNVWEWTADWYGESFYAESQLENPTGPGSGSTYVLRGGSWNGDAQYVRTAIRIHGPADYRRGSTGFRPARSP
jgi:formylglycine-generating enzyme required for sulfatase activity